MDGPFGPVIKYYSTNLQQICVSQKYLKIAKHGDIVTVTLEGLG